MAIRLGVRASLSKLDSVNKLISIEGVAGSLEEGDINDEKIILRAMEETKEELGIEPAGAAIKLGSFFTALEVTSERSTSVLVEVDPSKTCEAQHAPDEIQDTRFIELDDLIHACDQGIVIDERLEVSARLLKAMYRYHDPYSVQITPEQKVGFLGGSFDPFHDVHLEMGELCLKNELVDVVLYVPTAKNPFKEKTALLSAEKRADAIAATISEIPGMYVSTHEIDALGEGARTIDSIHILKQTVPELERLFFIGGSDLITSMYQWSSIEKLLTEVSGVLLVQRDSFSAMDLERFQSLYSAEAFSALRKAVFSPSNKPHASSLIRKLLDGDNRSGITSFIPKRVVPFLFD